MNLIRLFSLSSFRHTDYWWYRHQVEVLPFHNAGFHSCRSLIWSKAEPHLEILWGRLAFGVRILHWSPPLFDICPIRPTTSEIWTSSTSGFNVKYHYNVCVFRFFGTKLNFLAKRSTFAYSMSYIFWKLFVWRLIWYVWGPSMRILWPVRFFVTKWESTGSISWNLVLSEMGGTPPPLSQKFPKRMGQKGLN